MKHLLRNIFFYANIIAGVSLLFAYIATYISPASFFIPAFFGLAFPFLFLINVLFLLYWISIKNVKFLLSALILAIGWQHISGLFQFNLPQKTNDIENKIKIISYNVRLFDLYNWSNNTKTRNKIFDFIKERDADILCLQEFYNDKTNYFPTLDSLVVFQKAKNVHSEYTYIVQGVYKFGIATFSKYPIINKGKILFNNSNNNICIYTDLKIHDDTLRIYNNHLESIHFQAENYNFIDSIASKNEKERLRGIKDIFNRLKKAYTKRAYQAEIISNHIKSSPYPVIVCGDFNDTPVSYSYKLMSSGLQDSFREKGFGFGSTFSRNFLFVRIDYLLHSRKLETLKYRTYKNKYSDHYPIEGEFIIK